MLLAEAEADPDSLQGSEASSLYEWLQLITTLSPDKINKMGSNINPRYDWAILLRDPLV